MPRLPTAESLGFRDPAAKYQPPSYSLEDPVAAAAQRQGAALAGVGNVVGALAAKEYEKQEAEKDLLSMSEALSGFNSDKAKLNSRFTVGAEGSDSNYDSWGKRHGEELQTALNARAAGIRNPAKRALFVAQQGDNVTTANLAVGQRANEVQRNARRETFIQTLDQDVETESNAQLGEEDRESVRQGRHARIDQGLKSGLITPQEAIRLTASTDGTSASQVLQRIPPEQRIAALRRVPGTASGPVAATPQDLDMAARTIIGESRGQPLEGQVAVAHVIKNRVAVGGYGGTPTEVVLKPYQFEPWGRRRAELEAIDTNSAEYKAAMEVAKGVFSGVIQDPTGGATHFANVGTVKARGDAAGRPGGWLSRMSNVRQIGAHTFGNADAGRDPVAVQAAVGGAGQPVVQPASIVDGGSAPGAAPTPPPSSAGRFGPGDVYSLIPEKDDAGRDQIAQFKSWNADPIGNHPKLLASAKPAMQAIYEKAKADNPGLNFIIGSGGRTEEDQKKAVEFGWSPAATAGAKKHPFDTGSGGTSRHLANEAVDLWVLKDGKVTFDKDEMAKVGAAMKKAAADLGVPVTWGGDFRGKKDMPHFELGAGYDKVALPTRAAPAVAQTSGDPAAADAARVATEGGPRTILSGTSPLVAGAGGPPLPPPRPSNLDTGTGAVSASAEAGGSAAPVAAVGLGATPSAVASTGGAPTPDNQASVAYDGVADGPWAAYVRRLSPKERQAMLAGTLKELKDRAIAEAEQVEGQILNAQTGLGEMPSLDAIRSNPYLDPTRANNIIRQYRAATKQMADEQSTDVSDDYNLRIANWSSGNGPAVSRDEVLKDPRLKGATRNALISRIDTTGETLFSKARTEAKELLAVEEKERQRVTQSRIDFYERNFIEAGRGAQQLVSRDVLENDPALSPSDVNKLLPKHDKATEDGRQLGVAMARLQSGELKDTGFSKDTQDAVDRVVGADLRAPAEMFADDQKGAELRGRVTYFARETGYVAKSATEMIRSGFNSQDPARVQMSADFASRIIAANPNAFAAAPGREEIQQQAKAFDFYVNTAGMKPQEAAARIAAENDPEWKKKNRRSDDEVTAYEKKLRDDAAVNDLMGGFLGIGSAKLAFTQADQRQVEADFVSVARDFYARHGNETLAREQASLQLLGDPSKGIRGSYAPTWINGTKVLMKHAAEAAPGYPPVDGGHEYIYRQATDFIKERAGLDVPRDRLMLQPIPRTTAEAFRRGLPVPYVLLYQDDRGVWQRAPSNSDMGGWQADPKAAVETSRARMKAAGDQLIIDNAAWMNGLAEPPTVADAKQILAQQDEVRRANNARQAAERQPAVQAEMARSRDLAASTRANQMPDEVPRAAVPPASPVQSDVSQREGEAARQVERSRELARQARGSGKPVDGR